MMIIADLNAKNSSFIMCYIQLKQKKEPLRLFLSGSVGVGKSVVTNALLEALIRFLNSIAGEYPDDVKVVKTAPTGKVTFNRKGNTLHAAFKKYLPIEGWNIVYWTVTDRIALEQS